MQLNNDKSEKWSYVLTTDPGFFQFPPNGVLTCDLHDGEKVTVAGDGGEEFR